MLTTHHVPIKMLWDIGKDKPRVRDMHTCYSVHLYAGHWHSFGTTAPCAVAGAWSLTFNVSLVNGPSQDIMHACRIVHLRRSCLFVWMTHPVL